MFTKISFACVVSLLRVLAARLVRIKGEEAKRGFRKWHTKVDSIERTFVALIYWRLLVVLCVQRRELSCRRNFNNETICILFAHTHTHTPLEGEAQVSQ
jgi:hypothetical protein